MNITKRLFIGFMVAALLSLSSCSWVVSVSPTTPGAPLPAIPVVVSLSTAPAPAANPLRATGASSDYLTGVAKRDNGLWLVYFSTGPAYCTQDAGLGQAAADLISGTNAQPAVGFAYREILPTDPEASATNADLSCVRLASDTIVGPAALTGTEVLSGTVPGRILLGIWALPVPVAR